MVNNLGMGADTAALFVRLLKAHFPELGTDEPINGADCVDALRDLYARIAALGGRNFEHPVQDAVDRYLADGGSSVELIEMLADVADYAAPQTRPDDGAEEEGEYAELAAALRGLAAEIQGRGPRDTAVAELLAWARGEGIEEHDVDEVVADGLSAEASAINNGWLEAQLRHLLDKWGSVEHVQSMLATA